MFDDVGDFFGSFDSDDGKGLIVLIMVALALFGGIMTTRAILRSSAKAMRQDMAWKLGEVRDRAEAQDRMERRRREYRP